jgi:hypothetical protein
MPLTANPAIWIENNVISFFAVKYGQPTNIINWDSNVRVAFALQPLARWKSLGREMNRQDWIISINVLIDVDSEKWRKANTIGDITSYINDIYEKHHNFIVALSKDTSFSALLAGKAGRGAKKKTAKGKKSKKEKSKDN